MCRAAVPLTVRILCLLSILICSVIYWLNRCYIRRCIIQEYRMYSSFKLNNINMKVGRRDLVDCRKKLCDNRKLKNQACTYVRYVWRSNACRCFRLHTTRCNQWSPTFLLREGITRSNNSFTLMHFLFNMCNKKSFFFHTKSLIQSCTISFVWHKSHTEESIHRKTIKSMHNIFANTLLATEDRQKQYCTCYE